jgi:hypothetical protein
MFETIPLQLTEIFFFKRISSPTEKFFTSNPFLKLNPDRIGPFSSTKLNIGSKQPQNKKVHKRQRNPKPNSP